MNGRIEKPEPARSIACCADHHPSTRSRNSMLWQNFSRILVYRVRQKSWHMWCFSLYVSPDPFYLTQRFYFNFTASTHQFCQTVPENGPVRKYGGQWLPCVRSFVQGEHSRKEGFKCHGKPSRFTPWESSYRLYSNGYFANLVRKRRRYPSPEAIKLETRVETEGPTGPYHQCRDWRPEGLVKFWLVALFWDDLTKPSTRYRMTSNVTK